MDNPTTKPSHVEPELKQRLVSLYASMAKRLGIRQTPKITFTHNAANAKKPFGLTAYYNQQDRSIRVYVTGRHPTDILRSFAHELIHHWQNEHGALPPDAQKGGHAHYAQKDPVLRQREMEAYLLGNMLFRDWQDEQRYGPLNENLQITNSHALKTAIKNMLFQMIKDNVISSYHRDATSGDMKPEDFVEDMSMKLELSLEKLIDTVNNRGNWENQANMIRETISRSKLKAFIKERIEEMGQRREFDPNSPTQDDIDSWNKFHPDRPVKTPNDLIKARKKYSKETGWGMSHKDVWGTEDDYDNGGEEEIPQDKKFTRKRRGLDLPQDRNQNYAKWLKQALAAQKKQVKAAQKYYEIGFTPTLQGETHYCWYWNDTTKSIVLAHGGSHQMHFGKEIPYKSYRGRYDMVTKELSVTIPEFGALKKPTGDLEKDAPPGMIDALNKTFHHPKMFYFPFIV